MFVAESKAASVSVKQGELNGIISKLAHHGYEGMIHSMIRAACSIAGVDASQLDRESVLVGRRYIYLEPATRVCRVWSIRCLCSVYVAEQRSECR